MKDRIKELEKEVEKWKKQATGFKEYNKILENRIKRFKHFVRHELPI